MIDERTMNRKIVLNSRPSGLPVQDNFRLVEEPVPAPGQGEVLLRTLYLSLDPYMRGRMSEGPSYAPPVEIGAVMVGGTVSRVEASQHPGFKTGDLVLGFSGWQEYEACGTAGLTRLEPGMPHPSYALGVLGMPGFTAYVGLLDIGQPRSGETVVVAAATGAVGSAVGQIARIKGCRVVGIAGGAEKCGIAREEFSFDACIDRHAPDLAQQLAAACPDGIDVYFESVGGAVFDAVLPLLNTGARVPVCGLIAHYNDTAPPEGPDRLPRVMSVILSRRIKLQGFIIMDHYETRFADFSRYMQSWVKDGKVKVQEYLVEGLERASQGLIDVLQGKNLGKAVVRVGG
jgi:NADPH-dependent curcumin reductase CurA